MPRANRYIVPGAIYHVTQRCHDRAFLFRFAKDRDVYRTMLRERLARYPVTAVVRHYRETVATALEQRALAREAVWTESLAVGGEAFVRAMAEQIRNRMAVETGPTEDGLWCVREVGDPYSPFSTPKNGAKRRKP